MSSNITGWLYIMFVGWAQAEWTFARFGMVFRPSVQLSHLTSTKQYLLNYSVHIYSYHQKVKIIKQILTFVVRWIRDNIFQAKDVFTSHARWIRLLLEKYYHVFTSTKVNICIILGLHNYLMQNYRDIQAQGSWSCVCSSICDSMCDINM